MQRLFKLNLIKSSGISEIKKFLHYLYCFLFVANLEFCNLIGLRYDSSSSTSLFSRKNDVEDPVL